MKYLPVENETRQAIVDDEDYERLADLKIQLHPQWGYLILRSPWNGIRLSLAQDIMDYPDARINYINGDVFDCRKSNLKIMRAEQVKDRPCPACNGANVCYHNFARGRDRLRCRDCGKTFYRDDKSTPPPKKRGRPPSMVPAARGETSLPGSGDGSVTQLQSPQQTVQTEPTPSTPVAGFLGHLFSALVARVVDAERRAWEAEAS